MGSALHRSSTVEDETKARKRKRTKLDQNIDKLFDPVMFPSRYSNDEMDWYDNYQQTHELWDERYRLNKRKYIKEDSPGSHSTRSVIQDDIRYQTWQVSHELDNSFHSNSSFENKSPLFAPAQHIYQNIQPQLSHVLKTRSPNIISEQSVLRKISNTVKPLTNIRLESHPDKTTHEMPFLTSKTKPEQVPNHSSPPRKKPTTSNQFAPRLSGQKAVYVSIDHEATLAERSQTNPNENHHQNSKSNHTNRSKSSTRTHRVHFHEPHRHQSSNTPPISTIIVTSIKAPDILPERFSEKQQSRPKSILINKSARNTDLSSSNKTEAHRSNTKSDHETKSLRNRVTHQPHRYEQMLSVSNRIYSPKESSINPMDNRPIRRRMIQISPS